MKSIYKSEFLNNASKLDALTESNGKITQYATAIAEELDSATTLVLLREISALTNSKDTTAPINCIASALKDSLVKFYGYNAIKKICEQSVVSEVNRSLEELLQDLHNLIGLNNVKQIVDNLISYQQVQKLRNSKGLHSTKNTMHLAFMGNPGTGKTTVARIVGRIYKQIGLLSKGHFLEVSRTDLIAGYQGQTALKVKDVITKAIGGVLFIDEAYSITENEHSDSYGKECLTELTKALEDHRDDLVVIVAGYTDPMKAFFQSNQGLQSRFNTFIEFEDYSADDLCNILISMCNANDYTLSDDALMNVKIRLKESVEVKDSSFANARFVRNMYDDIIMKHAKRVIKIENPNKTELSLIEDIDI